MRPSEQLTRLRTVCLGLTGLVCLIYSALALLQNRPDPMAWWIPGSLGVLSALVISAGFFRAGRRAAQEATDELHRAVSHRAQRHAYWVSLALFVVVAVISKQGIIDHATGFAALGTAMGASYLLLFVAYEQRMSG